MVCGLLADCSGEFDEATHEWTDGILASAFREARRESDATPEEHQWTVLDGPVDPNWIESMNTVLDDNKKLCLNSGETIALTPGMKAFFEVDSLKFASPATVSRCGMVFMDPAALGLQPLMESWMRSPGCLNSAQTTRERYASDTQTACTQYARDIKSIRK